MFSNALVAIDGSNGKFKAVNNRGRNFTANKIDRHREQITASIEHYLAAIETADRQEPDITEAKTTRLREKIACLKEACRFCTFTEFRAYWNKRRVRVVSYPLDLPLSGILDTAWVGLCPSTAGKAAVQT